MTFFSFLPPPPHMIRSEYYTSVPIQIRKYPWCFEFVEQYEITSAAPAGFGILANNAPFFQLSKIA